MKGDAWVNSSAILGRMNFALALTSGKLKGVQVDSDRTGNVPSDPQTALAALENTLLEGDVSQADTRHNRPATTRSANQWSQARRSRAPVQREHDRGSAIGLARVSEEITGFN